MATFARFDITCPACPLQIEGHYGEMAFYFRARHGHTTLSVGGTVNAAVEAWSAGRLVKRWGHDEWTYGEALKTIADVLHETVAFGGF